MAESEPKNTRVTAHADRVRLIAKDGTVVVIEPFQTAELDMSKGPWTFVPESGEPS